MQSHDVVMFKKRTERCDLVPGREIWTVGLPTAFIQQTPVSTDRAVRMLVTINIIQ